MKKTKLVDYLQLRDVGFLEIMLALYPILANYRFGAIPFNLFILVILDIIVLQNRSKRERFRAKEFVFFTIFILLHEIVWLVVIDNPPSYFISSIVAFSILLISVIIISPALNWNKLVGSLNWVTIISLAGIAIQYVQVANGELVGQIPLPFLEGGASRVDDLYERPHSFFPEPAAYALFMLMPLFFSLYQKKFIWALIIAIGILASSSTTGLLLLFFMPLVTIFMGKAKISTKIGVLAVGAVLLAVIMNTDFFEASLTKLIFESENVEESARLSQGISIVSYMSPEHYVLGVPYATAHDFLKGVGSLGQFEVWGTGDEASVYITTFWNILLRFGVVGLLLYLIIYIKPALQNRNLWPLIACCLVILFSASLYISATFTFQFICIYSFNNSEKPCAK